MSKPAQVLQLNPSGELRFKGNVEILQSADLDDFHLKREPKDAKNCNY